MRRPLFLLALLALILAFLVEVGGGFVLSPDPPDPAMLDRFLREQEFDREEREEAIEDALSLEVGEPPGFGVRSLGLLDGQLLMSMALLALAIVVPHRAHGRVVGIVTLLVGILVVALGVLQAIVALSALFVMLGLFLAPPFGTLTYLAIYGFFDRSGAAVLLGLALVLKVVFLVLVLFAYPRFLREKGLMLMVATSFVLLFVVTLLHGFVPLVLVSITDAVAAVVVAVVAIAWALALMVGGLTSIVRVLRMART